MCRSAHARCLVIEGEIAFVVDTEEASLKAGDTVIQRGTNHAWSNRSNAPCVIAISSHDGIHVLDCWCRNSPLIPA